MTTINVKFKPTTVTKQQGKVLYLLSKNEQKNIIETEYTLSTKE